MESPKITFLIPSFHHSHLFMALNSLRLYQDRGLPFNTLIFDDNPVNDPLSNQDVRNMGFQGEAEIISAGRNVGCFHARWRLVEHLRENPKLPPPSRFMFLDSDDQIIDIDIGSSRPVINHNGVVVKRLQEALDIMRTHKIDFSSPYIENEGAKMGCVGIAYAPEAWFGMMDMLRPWLPELYKIYGSERILEPDDVIYMILLRVYFEHTLAQKHGISPVEALRQILMNRNHPDCPYHDSTAYSYALTMIEDRKGRYKVEAGVTDFRYGAEFGRFKNYEELKLAISKSLYSFLGYKEETALESWRALAS